MKNVKLKSMTHLRSHGRIMEKQMKPKASNLLIGKSCPIPKIITEVTTAVGIY